MSGLLAAAPELALRRVVVGASPATEPRVLPRSRSITTYTRGTPRCTSPRRPTTPTSRASWWAPARILAAANGRKAEPLHYAVDGIPGSAKDGTRRGNRRVVRVLGRARRRPRRCRQERDDALCTAPCATGARRPSEALLDLGADLRATNRSGSTALATRGLDDGPRGERVSRRSGPTTRDPRTPARRQRW